MTVDDSTSNNSLSPSEYDNRHLFVLIHGFLGSPTHLQAMKETILGRFSDDGSDVEVFIPKANTGLKSFDGVKHGAERILEELGEFYKQRNKENVRFDRISIVGYSLGGLYARYLIGILYEANFFDFVEPITFTTFATPHLGSNFYAKTLSASVLNYLGKNVLGVSGNDMFGYHSTVLLDMANPEGPFYKGLEKFQYLFNFTNSIHDRTVPFFTSYMSTKDPFKKRDFVDYQFFQYEDEDSLFVDMEHCQYRTTSRNVDVYPTFQERQMQIYALLILPWIFPPLLAFSALTTLVSHYRVKEEEKSKQMLTHRRSRSKFVAELLSLGIGEILDTNVMNAKSMVVSHEDKQVVRTSTSVKTNEKKLPVKPLTGDGTTGLLESTTDKLDLQPESLKMIEALNKLPWERFVVQLKRMHTHAEIVNRRNLPGQGQQLLDFWVDLVASRL